MLGINLSGAEFGKSDRYGYDYIYPSAKDLNLYSEKGLTLVRLPMRWERLQPELGGKLDAAELGRLTAFLSDAARAGAQVIVDVHNYGRYDGKVIGSPDVPITTFADFWSKLAAEIGASPGLLGYDLMNEPHGMPSKTTWPQAAQAATDAIRLLGDTHTIFVEGEHWANASNWAEKNRFLDVQDPLSNIVYEAHIYFDKDSSGTYKGNYDQEGAYVERGADRLKSFVSWLEAKDAKGFIGEFGVPSDDPRWQAVLDHFLGTLNDNGLSGTYWGAGPWFNGYKLGLVDKRGMATITLDTLLAHVADGADVGVGSNVPPPSNEAPEAVDDSFTLKQDGNVKGNVLANDKDADGDALKAVLKSGPAHGTISFSADGDFVYTPKAGFHGADSFAYAASDGKASDTGTVTLKVDAASVVPRPVAGDLVARAGTIDGSSAASEKLSGKSGANTFFFDAGEVGNDRIVNFEKNDVLAFDKALYDGNKDGIIQLTKNVVSVDAPKIGDMLRIDGVNALRFLGSDDAGHAIYGDASVRPRGAKESTLADNVFTGDKSDKKKDVFFFDTAIGADLGSDSINLFGKRDLLVTTTKLDDGNNDGIIMGANGAFGLSHATGSVALKGTNGAAISSMEFDGSIVRHDVTYYVYSLVGSTGTDTGDLTF